MAGSIVRPGHIPFGALPSDSSLCQINTALCVVPQLMQPALEQGLSYSEQIRTVFCAVGQIQASPRDGGFFFSGSENLSPWVSLAQTENFSSLKSRGNEGRQKNKGRKLVS